MVKQKSPPIWSDFSLEEEARRNRYSPQEKLTALDWAIIAARCSARLMDHAEQESDMAWATVHALEDLREQVVPMLARQVQ